MLPVSERPLRELLETEMSFEILCDLNKEHISKYRCNTARLAVQGMYKTHKTCCQKKNEQIRFNESSVVNSLFLAVNASNLNNKTLN